MKISRSILKDLIIEEVNRSRSVLLEEPRMMQRGYRSQSEQRPVGYRSLKDKDPEGYDGEVSKQALYHMSQQAQQLHDMLKGDENLKPEVQDKISRAANDLEEVFKSIMYDKGPGQGKL
jgi:hypothetical protein